MSNGASMGHAQGTNPSLIYLSLKIEVKIHHHSGATVLDRELGFTPQPHLEYPDRSPDKVSDKNLAWGWLQRCLAKIVKNLGCPWVRSASLRQERERHAASNASLPWAIQYALKHRLFPDADSLANAVPSQRLNSNTPVSLIRTRAILLGLKAFIEGEHPLDIGVRFYIEQAYLLNEPRSIFSPFGMFEAPTLLLTGGSQEKNNSEKKESSLSQSLAVPQPTSFVSAQGALTSIQTQWPDFVRLTPTGLHNSLIPLPFAYVASGKDRLEMEALNLPLMAMGLQSANLQELAMGMLENCLFLIEQFGFVSAGNRSYLRTHSAPPFLTSLMKCALFHSPPHEAKHPMTLSVKTSKSLLRSYRLAKQEYQSYWMSKAGHFQESVGLNRYYSPYYPDGFPFYHAEVDTPLASTLLDPVEMSDELYDREAIGNLHGAIESGWENSGRFYDRCNDFLPIDLNSLLYQYERDMAYFAGLLDLSAEASRWQKIAEIRRKRIERFCWNEAQGLFYDFDLRQRQQYHYPTLAAYYPLYTGLATTAQARQLVKNLSMFEEPWGLMASAVEGPRLMDAPFGTAPLHWVVLEGLKRYGYEHEAQRIAQKWIGLCTESFEKHGRFFERYNVKTGDPLYHHDPEKERIGWTHAAYGLFLESFLGYRIVEPAPNVIYIGNRFPHP